MMLLLKEILLHCQDQQKLLKNLLEFTTSQYYLGYSHDTSYEECTSIYESGSRTSGVYPIWLKERFQFTYVYCDMDLVSTKKGWTTIQRRMNGEVNFNRGWDDYVRGFGNPSSEHWLGLENIYRLSRQNRFSINILGPINIKLPEVGFDLEDWDGMKAFVQYTNFRLKSKARNYELDVNGLDEAFKNIFSMAPISGFEFSTPDRDNDKNNESHCASKYKSSWWFRYCVETHLNGPYPRYKQPMSRKNIFWGGWQWLNPNNTALHFASIKFYYSRDGL
ncbi:unnamed protein product [Clavelina lepadiformis]|uniref:Fibrinogen C-terminal domain-containing protein n=1 Tax=Clavelina lepadiformis TaxID=159417 RepID=A0ABP0G943_CLALP